VQFANGDVNTPWGKKRAEMGHPAPFNLKMMGVGNENWGPQYLERLKIFTDSLKAKYPEIKLVNSSGTDPNGARFDFLNGNLRKNKADIIDEHYYRSPEWFLSNATRYDNYDRNGSKVFAGEYAAQSDGIASAKNQNNWQCALAEAAFMTGLERNAQVVNMASYAPLFAHADAWQWTPDMIWVDNLNVYGTPNYYVQKLYSLYKGTEVVGISTGKKVVAGQDSLYASAVVDSQHNELIVKIVNASGKAQTRNIQVQSRKQMPATAILTSISTPNLKAINSFENAVNVSPKDERVTVKGETLALAVKPYSFNVLRLPLSK
jgi:alpha-L-arabinofuranosidase